MRSISSLLTSLSYCLSLFACGAETTEPPPPRVAVVRVAVVTVEPSTATLVSLGETMQLSASAMDASGSTFSGKTFTWSTSDANVLTVACSGVVTAVANGTATVTASCDGVNGIAAIEVNQVASRLVFTVQPTETAVGTEINPAVEITLQDAMGSTVADAAVAVTIAIGENPSGGSLTGTTTANAINGRATFTDLEVDKAGSGYTLMATGANLASPSSDPFDVFFPFASVSAGIDHTCAITNSGAASR